MRRKDREVNDFNELLAIIQQCKVCHIAFLDKEYPYVVPMNFGIKVNEQQIELYFHGAKTGKKHNLIKNNNKVAFVMEVTGDLISDKSGHACSYSMVYESIMGKGFVEYITEDKEKADALTCILNQYSVPTFPTPDFPSKMLEVTAVFKIKVLEMSGKKRSALY